jgi:glycosyltransferase involved in cell wall biosynthesis
VLAWPGPAFRAKNPYTWLLYSHLAELGVQVRDFSPGRALRGGYDILHLHWPEKALMTGGAIARVGGAAVGWLVLEAARRHGARVVWTTHNARPHETGSSPVERAYWSSVVRRVDAVIHPSAASRAQVEAGYPRLARVPHAVVPLGHFRGSYPDRVSREEARASFGIPTGAAVVCFVGLVRPYKNVPHLVDTVRALPPDRQAVLLVGGEPLEPGIAEEIERAAAGDPRVRLFLQRVPDDEVQRFLRAADLVALPFTDITNSGSALLALSFDRPVLVPRLGAMGELQGLIGTEWVRTFDGILTPALLDDALTWARSRRSERADLTSLDWPAIARQTLALYRTAVATPRPRAAGSGTGLPP